MKLRTLIAAALCVASTTAIAKDDVTSARKFDAWAKNIKSLYKGLKSYGLSHDMSYQYANKFISQNAFGWDITQGTKSEGTTADDDFIYWNGSINSFYNKKLDDYHEQGWIGTGSKIAVYDNHTGYYSYHGEQVGKIAQNYAPGATIGDFTKAGTEVDSSFDLSEATIATHSYGYNKNTQPHVIKAIWNAKTSKAPNAIHVKSVNNICNCYSNYKVKEGTKAHTFNPTVKAYLKGKLDADFIFVGAVDWRRDIKSAHAGNVKNDFLVAYGAKLGSKYSYGTSYAVPRVAGALALLEQKYPNLNNKQRKNLLLYTAKDLGAKGIDNVYGHGLLNINKAMSPFGYID